MASTSTYIESSSVSDSREKRRYWMERAIHGILLSFAGVSIITTVGIVLILLLESLQFFGEISVWDFLTGTKWSPKSNPGHFGVLPLFCGTFLVAVGSAIIAVPLGIGTAICLSEYASPTVRGIVKPMLEVLAGIPSVVFGYLAIVFVSPLIRRVFESAELFNAANASIVVGIMILPMVISLSEDALRSVPRSLREGAYALGGTKLDVTLGVVVPAALSGIVASFLLAIARAIGETMAVSLAAGKRSQMTLNPLDTIQTMTAYIVETSQGDTPRGTLSYQTIFAVGLSLFLVTFTLNIIAQSILKRMREEYE